MKLWNKLLIYFYIVIIFVLGLTAILNSLTFQKTIDEYLASQVESKFEELTKNISILYAISPNVTSDDLAFHFSGEPVNIEVYDNTDTMFASYHGVNSIRNKNSGLLKKDYDLINSQGVKIGFIVITYVEDLTQYNQSINSFNKNVSRNYGIIILISMLLGLLIVFFIAKRISKPINKLNEFTNELKKGNYASVDSESNTFEIDELTRNLNFLSHSLSNQENFRSNYAQDISHELRTPLTNLLLHLEGIRDQIIDADDETVNMLISEVNRLNTMVNNLQISFNKAEKSLELNLENHKIDELIQFSVDTFKPKLNEKNISMNLELDDNIIIPVDKGKFIQVINNLISNAIKASNENSSIYITSKEYKNRYVIIVKDNGVGISKDDLDKIFDRFYRVDTARNRATGGHGLGLTITKNYVELMGGKINVNSNLGKGSEFIITFLKSKN